jgi:hypothetical protein
MIMMRLFVTLAFFFFATNIVLAWGNDSVGPPKFRYSVSLQVGQPNKLAGAEAISHDDLSVSPHGTLNRYSYGTGATFRYFTDETFFLHLRFAYSARHQEIYDSLVVATEEYVINNVHETHQLDQVYYTNYNTRNLLFGLGGGHEGRYGRFLVRAGAEIGLILYTQNHRYTVEGSYDRADHDSLANGNQYHYDYFRGAAIDLKYPLVWGVGLSGHATLQYKVSEHFGIGATLYLGGFYNGSQGAKYVYIYNNMDRRTDSNGLNSNDDVITETSYDYNTRQFDFSPLNGQISIEYYFGRPWKSTPTGPY